MDTFNSDTDLDISEILRLDENNQESADDIVNIFRDLHIYTSGKATKEYIPNDNTHHLRIDQIRRNLFDSCSSNNRQRIQRRLSMSCNNIETDSDHQQRRVGGHRKELLFNSFSSSESLSSTDDENVLHAPKKAKKPSTLISLLSKEDSLIIHEYKENKRKNKRRVQRRSRSLDDSSSSYEWKPLYTPESSNVDLQD